MKQRLAFLFMAISALAAPDAGVTATQFATLPEATASFGSAVSDGWLYIYGGHVSPTHSYSTEAVSGRFHRMNLAAPGKWEELPGGPGMQGMNLAAHGGKIYRVGGMIPRNKKGEAADNYSTAECARFDPATGKWEELPPLPQPRSSHDVVVVGDKLIVVGGWEMKGEEDQEWIQRLAVMDLSAPKLEWKNAGQPFKRRALVAAAHNGKMYVVGGFSEDDQFVRDVISYDPAENHWTAGPKLPDGPGLAFAPAAIDHDGVLYVSLSDGTLYRLNDATQEWEKAGKGAPRVAHRLASWDDKVLVIGGADKGKNSDLIEAIAVRR